MRLRPQALLPRHHGDALGAKSVPWIEHGKSRTPSLGIYRAYTELWLSRRKQRPLEVSHRLPFNWRGPRCLDRFREKSSDTTRDGWICPWSAVREYAASLSTTSRGPAVGAFTQGLSRPTARRTKSPLSLHKAPMSSVQNILVLLAWERLWKGASIGSYLIYQTRSFGNHWMASFTSSDNSIPERMVSSSTGHAPRENDGRKDMPSSMTLEESYGSIRLPYCHRQRVATNDDASARYGCTRPLQQRCSVLGRNHHKAFTKVLPRFRGGAIHLQKRTLASVTDPSPTEKSKLRVNHEIPSTKKCLLVSVDGQKLGVFSVADALEQATSQGMDLVEVAPNARPFSVCRMVASAQVVLNSRAQKRSRQAVKALQQSRQQVMKEIRLSPVTQGHDFALKMRKARAFLSRGMRIRVYILFRRGQGRKQQEAVMLLRRASEALADIGRLQPGSLLEQGTFVEETAATTRDAAAVSDPAPSAPSSRRSLEFLMYPAANQPSGSIERGAALIEASDSRSSSE
jgi:translation initiation factor IF-3